MFFRYYSKQLRDDKLRQRRARVAEEKKQEEFERLKHFGLASNTRASDGSSLVEKIKHERGNLFGSHSSKGAAATNSPRPSTTLL